MRSISILLLFLLPAFALPAQDLLDLSAKNYCQYWGDTIENELYRFELNESVPQAVGKILGWAGREANFELVQTNVSSVAAVLDGDKRYLLYSQDFFYHLPTPLEAYALLAHEIGHLLNGHRFEACCRRDEELDADQFMGYVLFKSHLTDEQNALRMVEWRYAEQGFSWQRTAPLVIKNRNKPYLFTGHGTVSAQERQAAIARGWARADAAIQGLGSLAYYEDENKVQQAGLRSFPWPPPTCAERYTVQRNMAGRFKTLGAVDDWLQKALDNRRYWSRSYHYLPNGFALVTRLEQFTADGASKPEQHRWVDYPVSEGSGGIMDYLSSMFVPNKGYFRVFVFAVTDQPAGSNGKTIERAEAQKWLENATSLLPYDIAKLPVSERHFVEVLVYEFEANGSNRKANRRCPCAKPCREHLEKSGLLNGLR